MPAHRRNLQGTKSAIRCQATKSDTPLGGVVACAMHEAILHNVLLGHRVGLRAIAILSGLKAYIMYNSFGAESLGAKKMTGKSVEGLWDGVFPGSFFEWGEASFGGRGDLATQGHQCRRQIGKPVSRINEVIS